MSRNARIVAVIIGIAVLYLWAEFLVDLGVGK